MRRLRQAGILFVLATGLRAQNGSRDVNFYSIEKEQALGRQLANAYRQGVRTLDVPAAKAYLDDVGQRLAAKTDGPQFTYTFELVDDDQIFLHEPVAFPGGSIFVPASLILAATSEDELAGMLAHAMEHAAARHGTKQATRGQVVNQSTIPLIFMGGWTGYAVRQNRAMAVPTGFVKFRRQYELDADLRAVKTMAAAGYNPRALESYIERVQGAEPKPANDMTPYPDVKARVAALQSAIANVPAQSYPAHDGLAAIQEAVARLVVTPATPPAKAPPRLAR